jgi:hypothetical protein
MLFVDTSRLVSVPAVLDIDVLSNDIDATQTYHTYMRWVHTHANEYMIP